MGQKQAKIDPLKMAGNATEKRSKKEKKMAGNASDKRSKKDKIGMKMAMTLKISK